MPDSTFAHLGAFRPMLAVAAMVIAFFASLFFVSSAVNLVVLAAVAGGVLLCVTVLVPEISRLTLHPIGWTLLGSTLLCLVVSYQLSMSPDSSFAPTWVIAMLPIACFAALAMAEHQRPFTWLLGVLGAGVFVLALIADARFLLSGARAHLPLYDPNNFATLVYLAWIPLLHRWVGSAATSWGALATAVFTLAIFATGSRAGSGIVICVFVVMAALLVWRGGSLRALAVHGAAAALAFGAYVLLSPSGLAEGSLSAQELVDGWSIRALLNGSALAMFGTNGVMGMGILTFPLMYQNLRPLADQHTAGLFVHNDYVQMLIEGGAPMFLVLTAMVVAVAWRCWRIARAGSACHLFDRLGMGIAVLAAAGHALVNFVIYSLPLTLALGILAGAFLAKPGGVCNARGKTPALVACMVFAWVSWGYLVLDTVVYGVFQGQSSVPMARVIREDPEQRLAFARLAQRLNSDRGIPVLGEATGLARLASLPGADLQIKMQAAARFREARAADRWNPLTYSLSARFVEQYPEVVEAPAEVIALLIDACTAVDPRFAPCLDHAVRRLEMAGGPALALPYLISRVLPWLELMRREDLDAANRYVEWMRRYATILGDVEFLERLDAKVLALDKVKPSARDIWWPRTNQ
ncbi:MAG: hypothetical protein O7H39_05125 [Gammaproteobacteria bacterium]|nr:hypothetical protein [Gammaproteobacteria bacterium]